MAFPVMRSRYANVVPLRPNVSLMISCNPRSVSAGRDAARALT